MLHVGSCHVVRLYPFPDGTAHLSPRADGQAMRRNCHYTPVGNRGVAASCGRPCGRPGALRSAGAATRGRISTPFSAPSEPVRARTLAERLGSVRTNGPTGHQQRHRIRRVRLAEARGRVVRRHGHDRRARVDPREHLAEERPVDQLDHVALVLGTAVVGRDVRTLDVHVQRVEPAERVRGQVRPGRVVLLGQQPRGVDGLHPQDQRDPPFDGHLDEAPPLGPEPLLDRLQRRSAVATVPREDQVPRELPGSPARVVHLGRVEDPRRPSTNALVSSAARRAAGVSSSGSHLATTGSNVSSATPRCPSFR